MLSVALLTACAGEDGKFRSGAFANPANRARTKKKMAKMPITMGRFFLGLLSFFILDDSFAFEAGIAVTADDDVVVNDDVKWLCGADDVVGHVDIGAAGAWVAAWVVVHEDERRCAVLKRPFHDFARVGGGVVNRS